MSVLLTPEKRDNKMPKSVKKINFQLPAISPNAKDSKFNSRQNEISSVKRRKKEKTKKESIAILTDIEAKKKYNEICNLYQTPYDLCVKCLEYFPSNRNPKIINLIKNYLKDLIGLVDLISRIKNGDEIFLLPVFLIQRFQLFLNRRVFLIRMAQPYTYHLFFIQNLDFHSFPPFLIFPC